MDRFDAILWDMDGTLVDTERVVWIVMREAFSDVVSIDLPEAVFMQLLGQSEADFFREMAARYDLSPDDVDRINTAFNDLYVPKLRDVPPLTCAVERVREGASLLPQAIVTGSNTRQAETVCETLGIGECFQFILSCDDYDHGKPNPEPYLATAKRLGIDASRCLVIEDSPSGIQSGVDAGMTVVAVKEGNQGRYDLSAAHLILDDLRALDFSHIRNAITP